MQISKLLLLLGSVMYAKQECTTPCDDCTEKFQIKSVDYTGQSNGVFFNFDASEVDNILQRSDWNNEKFSATYLETDQEMEIVIFNTEQGASSGDSSGTTSPSPYPEDYFKVGEFIEFTYEQRCVSCAGSPDNREAAPACTCSAGYTYDENYDCIISCAHQCNTCELNSEQCTACKNPEFLLPDCVYPIIGYLAIAGNGGEYTYEKCAKQCLSCVNTIDECATCLTEDRVLETNCGCPDGTYEAHTECKACASECETCSSEFHCITCSIDSDKEINPFTGQCQCKRGYKIFGQTDVCKECYMIADICLEVCPPNTIQDQQNHVCIGMEYSMASGVGMIYIMGFFIVCVQFCIFITISKKLLWHYLAFKNAFDLRKKLQGKKKGSMSQPLKDEDDTELKSDLGGSGIETTLVSADQTTTKAPLKRSRTFKVQDRFAVDSQNSINELDTGNNLLTKDNDLSGEDSPQKGAIVVAGADSPDKKKKSKKKGSAKMNFLKKGLVDQLVVQPIQKRVRSEMLQKKKTFSIAQDIEANGGFAGEESSAPKLNEDPAKLNDDESGMNNTNGTMNDTAKPLVEDRSKEKKKTVLKKNARLSTFNKADGKKDSIMLPIEGITEEVEINSALDPKDNLNADDLKSVTSVAASNNATHRPLNPLADLDSSPMDKKDIAKKAKMRMSLAGTKVKGVNKFARKGTTIINPGMEESLGEKKDGEDSNGIPGMGTDQLMMIEDDDELIDL